VLQCFLESKPLFYDEIDYERMPRIYAGIASCFHLPKIVHIVGTNGKGTTGRFLATALYKKGFHVGHYTSPHIMKFNERIWYDGENISDVALEDTHKELLSILTQEDRDALSYFEYTTLLAMLFYSNKCDYIILEAGLGGEHDATSVFQSDITLITPIDKDHESFLGSSIEEIARTKMLSIKSVAIVATQKHPVVYEVLREIEKEQGIKAFRVEDLITQKDRTNITLIAEHEHLAGYLQQNLALSIATLNYLGITYNAENFFDARLFGRVTYLSENILIDVGHNVLAADSLQQYLQPKKYTFIYNSYRDKNYKEILAILKPVIDEVELIDVYNARIEESAYLQKVLDELGIKYRKFETIKPEKEYVVFGSFSVVEAFLEFWQK